MTGVAELYRGSSRPDAIYRGDSEVSEVYRGNTLVWAAQHALIASEPDYWYSLEDGAHYYNRGTSDEWLRFTTSRKFADRDEHAYTDGAKPEIHVPDSWADGFTLAGWFDIVGDRDSTSYLFSRGGSGRTLYVMRPGAASNGRVGIRFNPGNDLSDWTYSDHGTLPDSGWFHFALTWQIVSSSRNHARLFVNGERIAAFSWPNHAPLAFGPEHKLSVANVSSSNNMPLYGNVDDIAVWSRTLDDAEVAAIHRDGRVPTAELEPAPPYQEQIWRHSESGTSTFTVPSWAREVDYILLGGGGGGRQGDGAVAAFGNGGGGGSYTSGTSPVRGGTVAVYVGAGGHGTATLGVGNNTPGEDTFIQHWSDAGSPTLATAAGGARGSGTGDRRGKSPGDHSYEGLSIIGGAQVPQNNDGDPPGGGGGGGSGGIFGAFDHGRPGARGEAVIRFRSAPR